VVPLEVECAEGIFVIPWKAVCSGISVGVGEGIGGPLSARFFAGVFNRPTPSSIGRARNGQIGGSRRSITTKRLTWRAGAAPVR